MPINGKTADQMREEFYEALRREREEREASQRLFEERMERSRKEKDEEWKRITGEWGRFTNDEGGMVEYEGVSALRDLPEIGGMPVRGVASSFAPRRKGREYDGILYCEDAMVLLECKRRVTREHVRKFLDKQLPEFIRDVSLVSNGHKLYGAVVGVLIDKDARDLAEENGLFAIRIPANRRVEVLNIAQARPLKADSGKMS